jgi:hypothetical protein
LQAAEGWPDLGNPVEADEKLARIDTKNRAHVEADEDSRFGDFPSPGLQGRKGNFASEKS